MAMSNPDLHNIYHAYRHMYEALGVKDVDILLPPPAPMQPMDPASENILGLAGKKFKAFPKQDHQAHMRAHLQFMGTTMARNNPKALMKLQTNCMEHINLMAGEQIEVEFAEEIEQNETNGPTNATNDATTRSTSTTKPTICANAETSRAS